MQRNFVNILINCEHTKEGREQKSLEDKDPWLDPDDDWRYMTDKEILENILT